MIIPTLTLTGLSELLLLSDAEAIVRDLASHGCVILVRDQGWNPLAGGREYLRPEINPVNMEGVRCRLVAEISRMAQEPDRQWLDTFELHPADHGDTSWTSEMRRLLSAGFEHAATATDGMQIYQRGTVEEALLFPETDKTSPRLLMQLRPLFRNDE